MRRLVLTPKFKRAFRNFVRRDARLQKRIELEDSVIRSFTLEYWRDEGWYVGRLKEVPGVFSQGETLEELEENVRDAYRLMAEGEAESVPQADTLTEELAIEV